MNETDISKRINALAEQYRDYTAENLSKLVEIRSHSLEEEEVNLELKRQMEEAGFDEVRIDGLGNVIGRIGTGPKVLAIDAHMDTVGIGYPPNWDFEPLSGAINEGFVYGRGTVDQKGGAAAFVTAGRILKEIGVPQDLTVYCVGSIMEEDCDGLCWKYIVEEERLKPDVVICTEPTNMNIYRGHRGRMEIDITFRGISAHGSAPERGKNAIYMAAQVALQIEQLNERLKGDDFLGKGSVTVTEFFSASPSMCATADYVRLHLDRRLTWGETRESAVAEIQAIVSPFNAEVEVYDYQEESYTGVRYGMEKFFPTWKLAEDHPVIRTGVDTFKALFSKDPRVGKWTFSTNAVTINGVYGIPVIGFGPGNEALAHAPNEKVSVAHMVKASAFYALYAWNIAPVIEKEIA